jgi:hypothetical protein
VASKGMGMTGLRGRWRAVAVMTAVTACCGTSAAGAGALPVARPGGTTTAAITKDPAYRVVFDLDEAAPAGSRGIYAIRTDLAGRKPTGGESTTSGQRAPDLSSRGDQIAAVLTRRGAAGQCPQTDRVLIRALTSFGAQRFMDVPGYSCGETIERVLWYQPMQVLALVRTTSGGTRVAQLNLRDPGWSSTVWESPRAYSLEAVHGLGRCSGTSRAAAWSCVTSA